MYSKTYKEKTKLHYITLHYITLHYITLHCMYDFIATTSSTATYTIIKENKELKHELQIEASEKLLNEKPHLHKQ